MEIALKVGAACVMTAACAWGGRLLALTQLRRVRTLEETLSGVRRLSVEMLEHRLPVQAALMACGGVYAETARHMKGGASPQQAYERAREPLRMRGALLDSLEEGDMTALMRLFGGLGAGGVQKQRLLLSETEEELRRLIEQARRRQEQSGRLYTSLSALGGLAMALMMM